MQVKLYQLINSTLNECGRFMWTSFRMELVGLLALELGDPIFNCAV